jgi:uncharacterized protein (TIGR00645 family)
MRSISRFLEAAFETFLFNSRLIVILAVLGSLTSSVLMFIRGAILIGHTTKHFLHHWNDAHSDDLSIALISSVDSFLFATVLLIFAMGIYELFISKIDPASRTEDSRPNWLQIHSLDDLKGAVGKVILMILIVRLFESAVKMKYEHPLHLLYLGLAVLFVAAALYLQHLGHKKHEHDEKHAEKTPASPGVAAAVNAPVAPPAAMQPQMTGPMQPQMTGPFASEPPPPLPMQPFPTLVPAAPPPQPFTRVSSTLRTSPPSAFAQSPSMPPPTMEVPSSALTSLPMSLPSAPPPRPSNPPPNGPVPPRPSAVVPRPNAFDAVSATGAANGGVQPRNW